jgi:hypothetical protein
MSPTLGELTDLAQRLASLKGTEPADPSLRRIADFLANESSRPFGIEVPDAFSSVRQCIFTSILLDPLHLPGRKLASPILPLIIDPKDPRKAMILPYQFWPSQLVERWTKGQSLSS